jgi:hypothetical protein
VRFFSSGDTGAAQLLIQRLWDEPVAKVESLPV